MIPVSLRLRSSCKGGRSQCILRKAEKQLMNDRINEINKTISVLKGNISTSNEYLFENLNGNLNEEVNTWMKAVETKTSGFVEERQKKKFARLLERKTNTSKPVVDVPDSVAQELKSKWIVNLSSRVLNDHEEDILKKGLNFAVTPSSLPVEDYVIGIESACRYLGPESKAAETLRSDCVRIIKNAPPPKSNISKESRKALSDLAKDDSITILPADKGRSVVVLDKDDYVRKAHTLLSDTNTYRVLEKDPTSRFSTALTKQLKECQSEGSLDRKDYLRLYPTASTVPRFYGLPKVHKQGAPLRPIVASRGSITYELAKHLADILSPLVGKNGYSLKNSASMVEELGNITLGKNDVLTSFDVTALFTKVPVNKSLDVILDRLLKDDSLHTRTSLPPTRVRDLLATCLNTTYFQFQEVIYTQVEGAAMDSPVSPIVANLFMEWFEETALSTFPQEITLWRRYVDDTIVALNQALIDPLTTHINSIDPSIKFTREDEFNLSIPMLDTKTTRDSEGKLTFTVYRKPTHTDQYLQFDSSQPFQHKLGVIRTLFHRCQTLCSTEESKIQEIEHLKTVLSVSGYTQTAWDIATNNKRTKAPPPRKNNTNTYKGSISIPYVPGVSDAIARNIRKAGVTVHMKPSNTIRSRLVRPKDKVDKMEQSGCVYQIKCDDCDSNYVGETSRRLSERISEHHRSSSPVGHHVQYNKHSFSSDSVSILHKEQDWFRRGVAEALKIEEQSPNLNRGKERFTLPAIYQEITGTPKFPPSVTSREPSRDPSREQ